MNNNKKNNKVLSKISASSSNKQQIDDYNDDTEKQTNDKTGTNLVVNSQLDQNDNMVGTSASLNVINRNSKNSNNAEGKQQKGRISTSASFKPTYSLNENGEDFKAQEEQQGNESNEKDNPQKKSSTTGDNNEKSTRSIKAGNKKLSVVQANGQPIYQAQASAFSLTNGKETQSSNENIDNGYYTMTHTTPYHHLMEEDQVPVNTQKKEETKKNENQIKSKQDQQQKHFSKVYNEDGKKIKKQSQVVHDESHSEEIEEVDSNANKQINSKTNYKAKLEQQLKKAEELKIKNTLPTRKDIDKKNFINIKEGQRGNLPVAKAYEGSDSGEEIDTLVLNERYKEAVASANRNSRIPLDLQQQNSRNQILKHSKLSDEYIDEEYSNNDDSQNGSVINTKRDDKGKGMNNRKTKVVESKSKMKNYQNDRVDSIDDEDESTLASDASSVIYREKPTKASKR